MSIIIRPYLAADLPAITEIWNIVVEEADAFPQTDALTPTEAEIFFGSQTLTAVAIEDDAILGLYILHPNNIGRCGHIANASYAVKRGCRGKSIGEKLVRDCLARAGELGFRIMQFNAVVCSNAAAIHLYEKIGFQRLGTIPGGFRLDDGSYTDIIPFYIKLETP